MIVDSDLRCWAAKRTRRNVLCCLLLSLFTGLWTGQADSQIARDGSLGQTPGALSGPKYTIDVQNAAQQIRGNNLFHSFSDFNVNTGQTATFTGPNSIANIINRVTGQNLSNIDGAIHSRAAMPNANLFLMNPNGLVLGPNASFNVGGSIHFTTADYARMSDGAQFFASLSKQSTLSSASVTAFGFLGEHAAGPITVQAGSPIAVDEGKSVSLVGGDISISGRTIAAPGGQINVASLRSAGEQSLAGIPAGPPGSLLGPTQPSSHGSIQLASGAMLQTSSDKGSAGSIVIRGGQLVMDNATLEANTSFKGPSPTPASSTEATVSIHAEHVALSNGSTIAASTTGTATAGDITFEVGTLRSNAGTADGSRLSGAAPVTIASNSTGQGGAGSISIMGKEGGPADAVLLSKTDVVTSVTNAADPTVGLGHIKMTARQMELTNGTVITADTTGGADAGAITLNVASLRTQTGPDGRVLISSSSNCGEGCLGGQAGDITIQGIPGVTASSTRSYRHVARPDSEPDQIFTFYFADSIDLRSTDIHSNAIGHAPGGKVIMRGQEVSFIDTNISVATQDFQIEGDKPNGQPARYQGFSNIDIMAKDLVLKDSTIKADALVSDIGACPLCQGGPSAGEIWLRTENSLIADNSSITSTSRGRAQAGITKIIGDHYFSFGALWDTLYPDKGTGLVKLTNSEVTVEAQHTGLPGYLRIRADHIVLDHSILNQKANDVSNVKTLDGELIDVVGAGERSVVVSDGRSVQGSFLMSAKRLDITGGGIVAPTQGNRIASRMDLQVNELNTHPGTRPGGTLASPQILNDSDPTRVVISSSSTGSGGAGTITISGQRQPAPGTAPLTPAKSISLDGTDVLTDTRADALGGKIELNAGGPIELHNSTISSNVHDVRPQSATVTDQGGNIAISAGNLLLQSGGVSALSTGTQSGGNIVVTAKGPITMEAGATISASGTGSGDAGNINVRASGPIELNAGRVTTSSLDGKGGSIAVRGAGLDMTNRSTISAESHGLKNAGKVELTSENNISVTNSTISTEALKASGGDIKLTAPNSVTLSGSTLTASVAGGNETTGGKIDIDPQYVVIQNSHILAKAADGNGGRIAIEATQAVLVDPSSRLDATSSKGISGQVLIQSPIQQLAGAIAPLPQAFAVAANLYGQRCAAQKGGQFSSFVQGARDGIPPQPGDLIASPMMLEFEDTPLVMGSQPPSNLPAVRLGLPEFEPVSQIALAAVPGCRS